MIFIFLLKSIIAILHFSSRFSVFFRFLHFCKYVLFCINLFVFGLNYAIFDCFNDLSGFFSNELPHNNEGGRYSSFFKIVSPIITGALLLLIYSLFTYGGYGDLAHRVLVPVYNAPVVINDFLFNGVGNTDLINQHPIIETTPLYIRDEDVSIPVSASLLLSNDEHKNAVVELLITGADIPQIPLSKEVKASLLKSGGLVDDNTFMTLYLDYLESLRRYRETQYIGPKTQDFVLFEKALSRIGNVCILVQPELKKFEPYND